MRRRRQTLQVSTFPFLAVLLCTMGSLLLVLLAVERKALARMTADLLQLERALAGLKAARERERQTYSVIPYRGRRGESRRPLYVECGPAGVVFHPERLPMSPAADPDAVRAEVERR